MSYSATKIIIVYGDFFISCFILFLVYNSAYTQQTEGFVAVKDKENFQGYSIHLTPVPGSTFGFVIIEKKKIIWSQITDIFKQGREGFLRKQDAYKVAEWLVGVYVKNRKMTRQILNDLTKQPSLSVDRQKH